MRLLSIFLGVATQIPDTKLQTKLRENVFLSKGTPSLDTNGFGIVPSSPASSSQLISEYKFQQTNKQTKNALLRTSLLWSLCFIFFGNTKLCAALSVESQAVSITVMNNRIIRAFRLMYFLFIFLQTSFVHGMKEMTVLPQTETFRQALEHLHSYTEASPADVVATVLEASSTTAASMSVVHQTVAFIVSQLCFVAPQDAESIERLLSAEVATSFGATQTLSKEWRDALTSAWLASGKGLVQAARERTVERYCYGGQQTTNPRFLSVEAAVVTSSGSVLENISAATNEPSDVSVDYTYEVNRHVPVATVQFPPTSAHLHRTPVVLESEGMYKLFLELDNIQKAVDVVKGAAS